MAKNNIKPQTRLVPNPLEAGKALSNELTKTIRQEATEDGKAFMSQLLNLDLGSEAPKAPTEEKPATTDSGVFELFVATNHKGEGKKKTPESAVRRTESRQEAAMNYSGDMKNNGERAIRKHNKTTEETVAELKNELTQIAKSAPVRTEFAHVTLNQDTRRKGTSDVNFLEFAIKIARASQAKTEDSGAWLKVGKGKHGKKGGMDLTQGKNHVTGERTTVQNTAG